MLLEISGATVQILIPLGDQVPGICALLLRLYCQVKPSWHSVQYAAVTLRHSVHCHFMLNNSSSVRVCLESLFLNAGVALHL
jgi:hypothetical protein